MVSLMLRFHMFEIVVCARPERLESSYIVHEFSDSDFCIHLRQYRTKEQRKSSNRALQMIK